MAQQERLTDAEVRRLAEEWYHLLDVHAPIDQLYPLLADAELEMVFPEATVRGHEGFKGWYERVIRLFFDEVHTLNRVELQPGDGPQMVKVDVNWQCKIWNPPAPKSEWLGFDAAQTWEVGRAADGRPVIVRYIVDGLTPMPGSGSL